MPDYFAERVPRSFAFGAFPLLPERRLLLLDGRDVRIGGRALENGVWLVDLAPLKDADNVGAVARATRMARAVSSVRTGVRTLW